MNTRLYLLLLVSALCICTQRVSAQLVTTPNTAAAALLDSITGNGVTVSNIVLTCPSGAYGSFNSQNANVGITSGIMLTTGNVNNAKGPNNTTSSTTQHNTTLVDPDLTGIERYAIYDVCKLEFDIIPTCPTLSLSYVFGSEEYPEFVDGGFNDAFGFFVSGPNPGGGNYTGYNIARLPNANNTIVVIDSVNNVRNSAYYINNKDGDVFGDCLSFPPFIIPPPNCTSNRYIQYDGFTVPLVASIAVTPCSTYHMKLIIADAGDDPVNGDWQYDSGVFLTSNGLTCATAPVLNINATANYSCASPLTGTATVNPTGGTAPYTYRWSNGQLTQTATNLVPGTYTVTVTDNTCLTNVATVTLAPPVINVVALASSQVNVACAGDSTGVLFLSAAGGTAPYTYTWGNGVVDDHLFNLPVGNYPVTVVDAGSCTSTGSFNITGPANPVRVVTNVTNASCTGVNDGSVVATGGGGTPNYTYRWSTGQLTSTINGVAPGTYIVTITDANGCTHRDTAVVLGGGLTPVYLGADTIVCTGSSVTLNAGTATNVTWSTGATNVQTINVTTTGTYSVAVQTSPSCIVRDTININFVPLPVVNLGPDTTLCLGSPITLNAGNAGATFAWSNGPVTQTISPTTSGTYTVTVTTGCSATDSKQVTFVSAPAVNLGNDTTICAGQTITLNAGNAGATFLWSTGAVTQTITASAAGSYSVRVTVGAGCIGRDTMQLTVLPVPTVNLGNDTAICGTGTVLLDAGNAGATYTWSNGAVGQTQPVTTTGTYHVTVSNGTCTDRDTIQVTFNPLPIVAIGNDTTICAGQAVTLDAGNNGSTYLWSNGAVTQAISANTSGTYSVRVTAPGGCIGRDTMVLTVIPVPVVNLGNDTAICGTGTVLLNAGNAGATYTWSNGAVSQTQPVTTTGTYHVTVSNSGCTDRDTIQVTFNPLPIVNIGNDTTICAGQAVTLDAGNNGSTYLWSNGAVTQAISANTSGTYSVRVTTPAGCIGRDTMVLTVIPMPVVNLGNDTAICGPGVVLLNAGPTGTIYTWSNGSAAQITPVSTTGTYHVTVSNGTCTDRDTIQVTFNPLPIVSIGNDTTICAGQAVTLDAGNNGATYLWSNGAVTQAISANISGTYWVRVTDAAGCIGNDTMALTVIPYPVVNLGNDTAICGTGTVLLDAGNAGATSYTWSNGAVSQTQPVVSSGTYHVTVSNSGCTDRDTITVTFNPIPVVTLGPDQSYCVGSGTATLDAGNVGATYLWSNAAVTQTISPTTSGTYSVEVTNASGCIGRDTAVVTYVAQPAVNLGNDTVACANETIIFDAGNPGFVYSWSNGAVTQTISPTTSGIYRVTVTNSICQDADTVQLTFNAFPIVSLGNDVTVCAGQSVTLDAGNAGLTTLWSTGAGSQTITVNTTGTYSVQVTNAIGCTGYDTIVVTISTPPVAALGADRNVCAGTTVTLDATVTGGTIYSWSTGASTPSISPLVNGTYRVTVYNAFNCFTSDTVNVTFNPNPVVTLGADDTICAGQSVTIDAGNAGATYAWTPSGSTQTISATTTGTYSVVVTDGNGCTGTDSKVVTVVALPVVNLADVAVCDGQTVTLDALNPGATYIWTGGGTTQTISPATTGTYSVTVTVGPGCSATDAAQVTFNPNPVVDLGNDTTTCIGATIVVDAGQGAGIGVTWSTGASTPTISTTASGLYWAEASLNTGCTDRDSINLTFEPAGTLDLGTDFGICENDTVIVLDAQYSGPEFTYEWSTGAVSQTISVATAGTYAVTVTKNIDCHFGDEITFSALPLVALTLADTSVCEGEPVALNAGNAGIATAYIWSTGGRNQVLNVTEAGTYSVEVQGRCNRVSAQMMLENRNCECEFDVPNAFSPERSKGHNDVFMAYQRCENLQTFNLKVFNRWGELIFESFDPTVGWDGYYKGNLCLPDVYVWVLTYTGYEGTYPVDIMKKGSVTLMR